MISLNLSILIAAFAMLGTLSYSAYADPGNVDITGVSFEGGVSFDVLEPDGIKSVTQLPGGTCPGETRVINPSCSTTVEFSSSNSNQFCRDLPESSFEITDCQADMETETWLLRSTGGQGGAVCIKNCGPTTNVGALTCKASLNGAQEVPPVVTGATGQATLQLNQANNALAIDIEIVGLNLVGEVTGAHIHNAFAGSNGPVVFGFIAPNNDLDGDLVVDSVAGTISSVWDGAEGQGAATLPDLLVNLANDGLYINIHTQASPGGEIRGQIICEPTQPEFSVGGEFLQIETASLLLAAAQSPASWLTSLTIAALGIGVYVFTRNPNNVRNIKVILRDYLDRF